jgi:hypothetical protein
MVGCRMRGCWEAVSWFVIVISLAVLQLHDMDGVAGSRIPHELVLTNCFKVWIVGIIFCKHHLFGDGQIAYVSFIMLWGGVGP